MNLPPCCGSFEFLNFSLINEPLFKNNDVCDIGVVSGLIAIFGSSLMNCNVA